jgi:hypothetical protein
VIETSEREEPEERVRFLASKTSSSQTSKEEEEEEDEAPSRPRFTGRARPPARHFPSGEFEDSATNPNPKYILGTNRTVEYLGKEEI